MYRKELGSSEEKMNDQRVPWWVSENDGQPFRVYAEGFADPYDAEMVALNEAAKRGEVELSWEYETHDGGRDALPLRYFVAAEGNGRCVFQGEDEDLPISFNRARLITVTPIQKREGSTAMTSTFVMALPVRIERLNDSDYSEQVIEPAFIQADGDCVQIYLRRDDDDKPLSIHDGGSTYGRLIDACGGDADADDFWSDYAPFSAADGLHTGIFERRVLEIAAGSEADLPGAILRLGIAALQIEAAFKVWRKAQEHEINHSLVIIAKLEKEAEDIAAAQRETEDARIELDEARRVYAITNRQIEWQRRMRRHAAEAVLRARQQRDDALALAGSYRVEAERIRAEMQARIDGLRADVVKLEKEATDVRQQAIEDVAAAQLASESKPTS